MVSDRMLRIGVFGSAALVVGTVLLGVPRLFIQDEPRSLPPLPTTFHSRTEAVRTWLEHPNAYTRERLVDQSDDMTTSLSRVYCDVDLLGHDAAQTRVYAWVLCAWVGRQDNDVVATDQHSDPVVLQVTGTGAATRVHGVEFSRDPFLDSPDLDRLFPPAIAASLRVAAPARLTSERLVARARSDFDALD